MRNIPVIFSPDAFLNVFLRPFVVVVSSPAFRDRFEHVSLSLSQQDEHSISWPRTPQQCRVCHSRSALDIVPTLVNHPHCRLHVFLQYVN
jgi:hypothetical protein